jgi:hypothetical protein
MLTEICGLAGTGSVPEGTYSCQDGEDKLRTEPGVTSEVMDPCLASLHVRQLRAGARGSGASWRSLHCGYRRTGPVLKLVVTWMCLSGKSASADYRTSCVWEAGKVCRPRAQLFDGSAPECWSRPLPLVQLKQQTHPSEMCQRARRLQPAPYVGKACIHAAHQAYKVSKNSEAGLKVHEYETRACVDAATYPIRTPPGTFARPRSGSS